jgi:hypothetical protein
LVLVDAERLQSFKDRFVRCFLRAYFLYAERAIRDVNESTP